MSEFKGTKGKWRVVENDNGNYTMVVNADGATKLAVARNNSLEVSNANLLLISKAPEMLEMLKEIKDYLGSDKRAEVEQLIKEATTL